MRPIDLVTPCVGRPSLSTEGQVSAGARNQQGDAVEQAGILGRCAILLTLSFSIMSCRGPKREAGPAAAQAIQPHEERALTPPIPAQQPSVDGTHLLVVVEGSPAIPEKKSETHRTVPLATAKKVRIAPPQPSPSTTAIAIPPMVPRPSGFTTGSEGATPPARATSPTTDPPPELTAIPPVRGQPSSAPDSYHDTVWSGPIAPGIKASVLPATPILATPAPKSIQVPHASPDNPEDQAALALVARNDKDWIVRKAAVERLSSQPVLADVARSDEDADVRRFAVSRLTVQSALIQVATTDKDWTVRDAAVALLTDQDALADIAMKDEDSDIRKRAVSRLKRQSALARIATTDKDWTVRRSAVDRLTDKAALALVARSDRDPDIRKLAVSKLGNHPSEL